MRKKMKVRDKFKSVLEPGEHGNGGVERPHQSLGQVLAARQLRAMA